MARPRKAGLDYFPLDVDLDDKFDLIEAEFGMKGFAAVIKLFQRVYKNGYYTNWSDEIALVLSARWRMKPNAVSAILSASIKRGIFDQALFEKHRILTSAGIQKRYLNITSRRVENAIKSEYLLISDTDLQVYVDRNENTAVDNPQNVSGNPQRKEKEKKQESLSKNVSNENSAYARESYEDILDSFGYSAFLKQKVFKFIQFQQANKKIITNAMLKTTLVMIESFAAQRIRSSLEGGYLKNLTTDITAYKEDVEHFIAQSIEQALKGKHFDLTEPKGFKTSFELAEEANQDLSS